MDKVLPILDKVLPILLNKNNLPLILIFVGLAFIILTFVEITLHPPRIRPTRARKLKGTHANLFATGTVVSLVGFGLFLVETFFFSSPPPNPLPGAQKSTPVPTVSETLAPPIGTFHDDFNTPTLDSTLWQIDATNGASITIQNNQLVSSVPKNAPAQGIISSVNLYSIVNQRASIQVVQISPGSSVDTAFGLQNSDGSKAIQVYVSKGHTIIVSTYQGPQVCHTNYTPSTQQWWSIRENEGTTYVDVSPDGKTWETLCSHADIFDMTHVRVFTTVNEWDADPTAGNAIFDNFVTT